MRLAQIIHELYQFKIVKKRTAFKRCRMRLGTTNVRTTNSSTVENPISSEKSQKIIEGGGRCPDAYPNV